MILALEKLSPAILQDKNDLAVMLQAAFYNSGDDVSLVAAAAWNKALGLIAVVCYEEDPSAAQFYMLDCRTGEILRFDSSDLHDSPLIEDINFSPWQNRIDLDLACTEQPRQAIYDLQRRLLRWALEPL